MTYSKNWHQAGKRPKPKALWTRMEGGIKPNGHKSEAEMKSISTAKEKSRQARQKQKRTDSAMLSHSARPSSSSSKTKQRKKIASVSKAMARRRAEHAKVKARYLKKNKWCVLTGQRSQNAMICGPTLHPASDIHHKLGRVGKLLNDESKFMAVCRCAHTWIGNNLGEAKERGWILPGWNGTGIL